MNILIFSYSGDIHAGAVDWLLEQQGHRPLIWALPDFPEFQTIQHRISNEASEKISISGPGIEVSEATFDAVWLRRFPHLHLPDDLHPADREFASREGGHFLKSFQYNMGRGAFWVNPVEAQMRASHKSVQLQQAKKVGLNIPDTLLTNDPNGVRNFFKKHGGNIIYKSFLPACWSQEEGLRVLPTTKLTAGDLADDQSIQLCPAIYQPYIEKQYELRLTFMGRTCFAVKLNSQESAKAGVDWRRDPDYVATLKMEPIKVSDDLYNKCLALMKRLGICFGCFDVIVTPTGEEIFLEVNEMGQFLWVEAALPEIPLLQAFSDFLVSRDANFLWSRNKNETTSYSEYHQSAHYKKACADEKLNVHRKLENSALFEEAKYENL